MFRPEDQPSGFSWHFMRLRRVRFPGCDVVEQTLRAPRRVNCSLAELIHTFNQFVLFESASRVAYGTRRCNPKWLRDLPRLRRIRRSLAADAQTRGQAIDPSFLRLKLPSLRVRKSRRRGRMHHTVISSIDMPRAS